MAKSRKKSKLPVIIVVIVLVAVLAIVFVPRLVHKCDNCGKTFVGTGYSGNIISEALADREKILCKDCAEKEHAVSGFFGGSIEDYKRPLFGSAKEK
ncbi:MAG: hypothetical protein K6G90_10065 [Clostridia bacterium]|nr:hypothetical protein [Clostridia bacterium]